MIFTASPLVIKALFEKDIDYKNWIDNKELGKTVLT